jgi:transcriptional regulator GlxA family with amidase domain
MGDSSHFISRQGANPEEPGLKAVGVAAPGQAAPKVDAKLSALIPVVQDARLRKMLRMIEAHPFRKIHDLALECNLSESRLQHLFKQRTGLGLGQLLAEQRMQQATDFLTQTNMSIKEIASVLGYEHASSFTRAFERSFRQAPSFYREAQGSRISATKSP